MITLLENQLTVESHTSKTIDARHKSTESKNILYDDNSGHSGAKGISMKMHPVFYLIPKNETPMNSRHRVQPHAMRVISLRLGTNDFVDLLSRIWKVGM